MLALEVLILHVDTTLPPRLPWRCCESGSAPRSPPFKPLCGFAPPDPVVGNQARCILSHNCFRWEEKFILRDEAFMTARPISSLGLPFSVSTSFRPRRSLYQARRSFGTTPRTPRFSTIRVATPTTTLKALGISTCSSWDCKSISLPQIFSPRRIKTAAMTQSNIVNQLAQKVEGLTLDGLAQKYPTAHPEINPLDLYRAHLSDVLSKISGVETSIIYPVVMWTQSLDKGDFVVAVPALRIKGKKADVLAQEWAEKVRLISENRCESFRKEIYVNIRFTLVPRG